MTVIRSEEIGTIYSWSVVESIFKGLYRSHEVDSFACLTKEDFSSNKFTPVMITELATEKNILPSTLLENFILCILPGLDLTKSEAIILKYCLIRVQSKVYRTFIIIREY